jgi:hypothetical protein
MPTMSTVEQAFCRSHLWPPKRPSAGAGTSELPTPRGAFARTYYPLLREMPTMLGK